LVIDKYGNEVKDLVSIIIPVYNTELYLTECLTAVTGQTYPYLDIIIIDNASSDSSVSICKKFMRNDPRIKLLTKPHTSSCANSRNMGLTYAKGKYISFIDSDDIPKPEFIETLLDKMVRNDVKIVQCCYEVLYESGDIADTLNYHQDKMYSGKELCKIMNQFIGLCGPNTMLWNKLYAREVFENERFYEGRAYEDMFLVYKLLYKQEKVLWIADRLHYWRKSSGSGTSLFNYNEHYVDEIHAYLERARFFRARNETELYELTLKRLYYISTQHLYLYPKFVDRNRSLKTTGWLKSVIRDTYPRLMKMKCWPVRTKMRMTFIRLFPKIFGSVSIKHKLDFSK
jgi:glycosyltransferase involved in cell wall biosynthesis